MNLIHTFFFILSLIIWARVIFSFIGLNHGPFYEFVYNISERVLKPIRNRLPRSSIDWSPFIALIVFDILGRVLYPAIILGYQGEWGELLSFIFYILLSLIGSVVTFLIIIAIVKIINDYLKGQHYSLTYFLNSITAPFTKKISRTLPYEYQKFSIWILLGLFIVVKMLLNRIISGI